MKVFIPNEELDLKIKKLIRSFRKQMDGEVSDQMKLRGIDYRLNFGINLVYLREKAKTLPQDIDFADRLWHRGIRETMILATLTAPRMEMPKEMAVEWASMVDNCELVEQTALNLFCKLPYAEELVLEWIKSDAPYMRALGYYTSGWMFRFNDVSSGLKQAALEAAGKETGEDDVFCLYRGMTHFMRQMLRVEPEDKKECEMLVGLYERKRNKNLSWVAAELKNELEFM